MAFRAGSYTRYEGPRSTKPSWWPLLTATLRRGMRSVWVKRITGFSILMSLGMMVFFYILNRVYPDWRTLADTVGDQMVQGEDDIKVDARFYRGLLTVFVFPILMPLSMVFGSELVASDLRTNALESYFSRPITPLGYIMGRTFAYAGFLMAATLLPLLIVWCSDVLTAPIEHFHVVSHVPLGLAQSLLLVSFVVALLVQAAATFTRNAYGANIVLGVFFVFFQALGEGLRDSSEHDSMLALSFLHDVYVVCSASLGITGGRHMAPASLAFAVVIGMGLLCFFYLWRTLKRRVLVG
jgi:hypothetical protein